MGKQWLIVALGSALGGVARVALADGITRRWGPAFPWGTMTVNVLGCLLIGVFFTLAEERLRLGPAGRLFFMAGFCGGFTTFSTLALETSLMLKSGALFPPFLYVAASAVLGISAFFAGAALGRLNL